MFKFFVILMLVQNSTAVSKTVVKVAGHPTFYPRLSQPLALGLCKASPLTKKIGAINRKIAELKASGKINAFLKDALRHFLTKKAGDFINTPKYAV